MKAARVGTDTGERLKIQRWRQPTAIKKKEKLLKNMFKGKKKQKKKGVE